MASFDRITQNFGTATKANVTTSGRTVTGVYATNANAAVRYVQLHNKATAPAANDVPILSLPIPVTTGTVYLSNLNINCTLGVSWAISTALEKFTDSATAAEHTIAVTYH